MRPGDVPGPDPPEPAFVRPFVQGEKDYDRHAADAGPGDLEETRPRPYMLTGGRARPIDDTLEIEAQVLTTRSGRRSVANHHFEHRHILLLCQEPVAVAEVAARLNLHLGVARVLAADLVALGHLSVRRPRTDLRGDVRVIERVIRGLQAMP